MDKDPLQKKQELKEHYQKRIPDKVRSAEEMGLTFEDSTFDYFREYDEPNKLTITLTYDEWFNIWMEAQGHLNYWCTESESVDKLSVILEEYRRNNKI